TRPALERGRAKVGRTLDGFEISGPMFVVTGRDEAEMAEAAKGVRSQIAFYGSTPAYRPVLELHGWGELQDELNRLSKQGRWAEMGDVIDDEGLDAFAVVARAEELAGALKERWGGALTRLSFYAPYQTDDDRWDAVMASLKSACPPGAGPPAVRSDRPRAFRRPPRGPDHVGDAGSPVRPSGVDQDELALGVAPPAEAALQLARAGLGQRARGDEHDVLGRDADHLADPLGHLAADGGEVLGLGLGHDDQRLAPAVPLDAEGDDVAGPHALELADGPLDVLGEDVASADDDDVLDAAAHDQLAVEQV